MGKIIDLHIHTCYSDGEYTPQKIYTLVKERNIQYFSITDHDTILGAKEIQPEANGPKYIPGIELSIYSKTGRMHLLGYNIDINDLTFNKRINRLRENAIHNVLLNLELLKNQYQIQFPEEEIQELVNRIGNIGRPDIAKLMIKYGQAQTVEEAFKKYLCAIYEKTRDKKQSLSEEEGIAWIKEAGGIPVLAHPISLGLTEEQLEEKLKQLKSIGLLGIEIEHIHHSQEYRKKLREFAEQLQLLESGGTDFHGPIIKPEVSIGTGINGNIKIKQLSLIKHIEI